MKPLALVLALTLAGLAHANPQGFYRQPALQGETAVFVSQGDLWRVGAQGGAAQRLTSHAGAESWPVLLPDGKTLAFVAQFDGPGDVYTMSLDGGLPQRRTWLGAAGLRLWGHDGKADLLLTAPALDGRPQTQVFRLHGEQLSVLPVADATDAALSADGRWLYFTRQGLRGDNAKNYRGGALSTLWRLDLQGKAEAVPLLGADFPRANNRRAMPYRDAQGRERIAFLSDRDGFYNLWSVAADGRDARAHSAWKEFDIRHASLSGGAVLVSRGADLQRVDLNGGAASAALPITLAGDQPASLTRWLARPQDFLGDIALAPNGERALLQVRGHLATQGTQSLRRAVLPLPDGVRCRQAVFSSDSASVFALCDLGAEFEIWQFDALGLQAPKAITRDAQTLRNALSASPDGRHLAHTDLSGALYLTDLKAEGGPKTRRIEQLGDNEGIDIAWHPDGQSLAYTRSTNSGARTQLWLYRLADGQRQALTSPRYDSGAPAFSPDGRWLYFASRRHFVLQAGQSVWADRNMGPAFEPGQKLYALALQPGLRSPFAPKDELPLDAPAKDGKDAKPAVAKLVSEGLAERLFELPLPAGQYRELAVDAKRLWWIDGDREGVGTLKSAAIEHGANADTVSERVRHVELSANGKQLLIQRESPAGPELLLVDAAPKLPGDLAKSTLRWTDWRIALQPRAEWAQMFRDAWRMQRDYFYDPQMHGIDWQASRARHEALLPRVGDRAELAELMEQLVSDLNLLHSHVGAGTPLPVAEAPPAVGGLGALLEPASGGARIARLYRGDLENPGALGPLLQPGVDAREGELITAINGQAVQWPQGAALLQGEAERQVRLELQAADGKKRQVIVTPVDARREAALRYQDWRSSRAAAVAKASHGRVGYLHLRAMGPEDIADFAREFYGQLDKEALIVDVRFNNGGNIDSWIIEKLLRRSWAFWQVRNIEERVPNAQQALRGPVAALINEQTYSDGETFAEGFKRLKLGTVIGKTTSGAGVWLSDRNRLVDRGIMRAANWAQLAPDGELLIEGRGVTPDLEVDNPPRASAAGADAQLEAAVAHLMQQLPATPPAERAPRLRAFPKLR